MRVARTGRRVGALLLAGAAITSAQPSLPGSNIVRDALGARIDTFLTRAALHGMSGAIIVADRDGIVLRKGYGTADRERGTAISVTTPFFIGSLAKQFTAAAVMRLVADGQLSLDDSLGALFSFAPADKRGITIRQLLSHTAGLPYLPSAGLFGSGTRDSVMREVLAERLLFPPGTRYEYSTPGYILLAGVIEAASGSTYEAYLRSMFERAHLTSTGFVGERARWSAAHVRSYSDANVEDLLEDVPALPRFVGAGSIVSTVGDLYRWYEALIRGEIVPDVQRDALFDPVTRLRPNVQEGLTWMLVDLPTGTLRQAAGDIGGFNAELRHYVDEGIIVVFVSNARVRGRGYREIVMNYVARLTRGESVPFPPNIADVPESRLESLPGTYSLSNGGSVTLWASGDSLMIGAGDAEGIAMLAGLDSAASARAGDLTARTRQFLSKVADGDSTARSFIHVSIPADARAAYIGQLRRAVGEAGQATVIGTAVDSPVAARSYVRLRRDPGDEIISLVWNGGSLIGLERGERAAYPLRLRAEGPDVLTSFDLFTGHLVRIEVLGDRDVEIESNGVRQRASR